jgi:hypothetical protein
MPKRKKQAKAKPSFDLGDGNPKSESLRNPAEGAVPNGAGPGPDAARQAAEGPGEGEGQGRLVGGGGSRAALGQRPSAHV